jgi:hypothetical protein
MQRDTHFRQDCFTKSSASRFLVVDGPAPIFPRFFLNSSRRRLHNVKVLFAGDRGDATAVLIAPWPRATHQTSPPKCVVQNERLGGTPPLLAGRKAQDVS